MAVNRTKLLLTRALKFPGDLIGHLCGEGDWHLSNTTKAIIEHFITTRNDNESALLKMQLSQPFFQAKWNGGRVNPIFYYLFDEKTSLKDEEYHNESLFQIEISVDGKKQRSNIMFVGGRLFSVELPKPLKFYEGKSITFGDVKRGRTSQSITRAIDRLEHGRDDDI